MSSNDVQCVVLCNMRTYRERLSLRFELKDVLLSEHITDNTAVIVPEEAFLNFLKMAGEYYDYKEKG